DQRSAQVRTALVGRDREHLLAVLAQPLQALDLLAEQNLGAVLEALLRAQLYQRLTLDLWVAGDVVDVLLGIDSRDLPAELLEAFDDPHRGIAMACVIRGRQARWAGAEDRDVGDVAHGPMLDAVAGFEVRVAAARLAARSPDGRVEPPAAAVGDEAEDVTGRADRVVREAVQNHRNRGRSAALRRRLGLRGRQRDPLPVGAHELERELRRRSGPRTILQVLVERRHDLLLVATRHRRAVPRGR